jgi:hypothetical protein
LFEEVTQAGISAAKSVHDAGHQGCWIWYSNDQHSRMPAALNLQSACIEARILGMFMVISCRPVLCRFPSYLRADPSSVHAQPGLSPELKAALEKFINEHKVVLFMKGTKQFPQVAFLLLRCASRYCYQSLASLFCMYDDLDRLLCCSVASPTHVFRYLLDTSNSLESLTLHDDMPRTLPNCTLVPRKVCDADLQCPQCPLRGSEYFGG